MKKLLHLILYGNFWIALAGLAMCVQTGYLLSGQWRLSSYSLFVGCGTLALYALHRTVGLNKVKAFQEKGRYQIIATYRNHILIYAAIGSIVGAYLFLGFSLQLQLALILPAGLGLAYVLPLFGNGRRLRDLHFIKIFLIALVWAMTTAYLPGLYQGFERSVPICIMTVERFFFVFLLTIPFDIRDLAIDRHTQVRTLPHWIGLRGSRILMVFCGLGVMASSSLLWYWQYYSLMQGLAIFGSTLVALVLCLRANEQQSDYYYTGWIDGCMVLQAGLVLILGNA